MTGYSALYKLFGSILDTGIATNIFHSVILTSSDDGIRPVAPVQGRFIQVGPDDKQGFYGYCRQFGPLEVRDSKKLGGCNTKLYRMQAQHKLVFFNHDEKRDHGQILSQLIKAVIKSPDIVLIKATTLHDDILRSESPTGRFHFGNTTFYAAIDFFVLLTLQADTCEAELTCQGMDNPFCK